MMMENIECIDDDGKMMMEKLNVLMEKLNVLKILKTMMENIENIDVIVRLVSIRGGSLNWT